MDEDFAQRQLANVHLFQIDVRLIGGSKRARTEDIEAAKGIVLEQDEILTLGSKKVLPAKVLRELKRHKDGMHRICMQNGTEFLGGYAIPNDCAKQTARDLDAAILEAQKCVDETLSNYPQLLAAFCEESPDWSDTIKASAYTETYMRERLSYRYYATRVGVPQDLGMVEILDREVGGLLGSVLKDVASEARALQQRSLVGKSKKTRKVLRPLKAAQEKLRGFAFLDRRVMSIVQMIDAVEKAMPEKGHIEGSDLAALWGITTLLMDPAKALEVAEQFDDMGQQGFVASLMPRAKPVNAEQLTLLAAPTLPTDIEGLLFQPSSTTPAISNPPAAMPLERLPGRGFGALAGLRR